MFNNKDYVLKVYRYKSFSKAAKELYISQPSLSASIKRIENEIGSPIFDRSTSPLSLTEVGKRYIESANEIKNIEDNFVNFVYDSLNMLAGEIKIGGSSMFSSFVLPPLISKFNKLYPNTSFQINEDHTQNLMDMLINGDLDIVIDNVLINNKSIIPHAYTSEVLMIAVPKKFEVNKRLEKFLLTAEDVHAGIHNLKEAPCVSLNEFRNEPFIFLKPENDTGKRAIQLCRKHNFTPNILFLLDQQMTTYNITCSGVGISFVSDTLIKHLNDVPDVCYYKLSDSEVTRNIYLYVKNNRYLSNTCRTFIDTCLSQK